MVAVSRARELTRRTIASRRIAGWSLEPLRIASRAKMKRPEAARRESRVEMLTETMRQKLLVRLLRHIKRIPVTAYRKIAATSTIHKDQ